MGTTNDNTSLNFSHFVDCGLAAVARKQNWLCIGLSTERSADHLTQQAEDADAGRECAVDSVYRVQVLTEYPHAVRRTLSA